MRKLAIFAIIAIAIIGVSIIWWNTMLLAPNPDNSNPTIFVISKGDGVREIASSLKEKGLIKSPIAFFLLIKKLGLDKKIEAGNFRLNPSMTADEIAKNITHGRLDIWVTIPEGLRAEEIGEILEANIPSYEPSWKNELIEKEGYLFPDTYLIPKDADIETIIALMLANFERKFESIKENQTSSLSQDEAVIAASLIEREAKFPEDRPLVASVLLNRLNIGMKLDIDATVQYILGFQENEKRWWKKNLTFEDLKINSPYNTYLNPGLPPAPIANPGLSALKAAFQPANTEYFYYVSDKTGHNHYANTLSEHLLNIERYNVN
jgi:UPF0755 protein